MAEKNNNLDITTNKKEFDSFFLTAAIFRFRYYLLGVFFLTAIVTSIFTLQMDNQYTASVNAVPSNTKGSLLQDAIGGLSSTLKEFGLTQFGGSSGSYEFIVVLFSRSLQDSLIDEFNLFRRYEIPDTARVLMYTELSSRLEMNYEKEGNYIISYTDKDPKFAAEVANYCIDLSNNIYKRIFQQEASISSNFLEDRINSIDSSLNILKDSLSKYSKKYMIFSPEEQAGSLSTAYTELKSELMKQEIMLQIMESRYGENDQNTLSQKEVVKNLRQKVNQTTYEPGFAGNFPITELTEVGIEYMRLYSEIEVFSKLKGFLLPMLEESRLDEKKNIQSLLVIDPAIPPDKKSSPKRSLIVAGSSFGMLILAMLGIIAWFNYRIFLNRYREFDSNVS